MKPPFPLPSEKLKFWLNSSITLENETLHPNLVKQIPNLNFKEAIESEEINEPSFLYLTDNPEITKTFEDYLDKKWLPWKEEVLHFKKVQKVYTNFFSIYQKQKSLGEQFELVIGVGLLNWRTVNDRW